MILFDPVFQLDCQIYLRATFFANKDSFCFTVSRNLQLKIVASLQKNFLKLTEMSPINSSFPRFVSLSEDEIMTGHGNMQMKQMFTDMILNELYFK